MIMSERTEYMFNIEIEHVTTQVLITLNLLFLDINILLVKNDITGCLNKHKTKTFNFSTKTIIS